MKKTMRRGSEAPEWQTILDSADMLRSMTESLSRRLPSPPQARAVFEYEACTIKSCAEMSSK